MRKGKGLLCVGYTEQEDEQDRIKQQFPKLMPDNPETLIVATAIDKDGKYYKDHDVHKILENKNIHRIRNNKKKTEWFEATLKEVRDAIDEIKNKKIKHNQQKKINLRDEQKNAIDFTASHFEKYSKKKNKKGSTFFMECKNEIWKNCNNLLFGKKYGMEESSSFNLETSCSTFMERRFSK